MKTTSGTAREAFLSFMTKASNIYFFCDNRVLTVILVFSCLFLGVIGNALSSSTNEYSTPRIIRYGFILHNRTHKTLTGIPFLSFLPVAINSNQRCDDFKASEPCKIETSVNGNRILNFHIDRIAPFESRKIDVRANLMMSETPVRLPATRLKKYLEPEKFIESGHPEIIRTARSLIRPNRSKTAEAFSGWVSNRIEYSGYLSRPRGALYAYRNKQGDCTEYAYLFAALCRAAGIPARCAGGYVCRGNALLRPEDYHNWAEFYDRGAWRIADPSRSRGTIRTTDYIAVKIAPHSENSRFAFDSYHIDRPEVIVKWN